MMYLRTCKLPWLVGLFLLNTDSAAASMDDVFRYFNEDFNRLSPAQLVGRYATVIDHLSGLSIVNSPDLVTKSRGELIEEYMKSSHDRPYQQKSGEQAGFEFILRAHGFLDKDEEYTAHFVDQNFDDLVGFYNFSLDQLVLLEGLSTSQMEDTLMHEMVHAGQNHAVGLDRMYEDDEITLDEFLARSAIVEGQAQAMKSLVKIAEYDIDVQQKKLIDNLEQWRHQVYAQLGTEGELAAFKLFPYVDGFIFVLDQYLTHEVKRFESMLIDLPTTTSQILHRTKIEGRNYGNRTTLAKLKLPSSSLPDTEKQFSSRLGEFYVQRMFGNVFSHEQSANQTAAAGWVDDEVLVLRSGGRDYAVWELVWSTEKDAIEFAERYRKFITMSGNKPMGNDTESEASGQASVLVDKQRKRTLVFAGGPADDERTAILKLTEWP